MHLQPGGVTRGVFYANSVVALPRDGQGDKGVQLRGARITTRCLSEAFECGETIETIVRFWHLCIARNTHVDIFAYVRALATRTRSAHIRVRM